MRPTVMEVSLQDFKYNIESIKEKLIDGVKIMPVIKANAYGTYINTRLDILNEFDIVAVAIVDEGVFLRKIGYEKEIFVLNQPSIEEIDSILENNLTIGISNVEFLKIFGEKNKKTTVHIEIETGMGRTGVAPEKLSEYIDLIQNYKNIMIEGIYTHLSSADTDYEYTKEQVDLFEKALGIANKKVKNLKYVHALASKGLIYFPKAQYNLVRPGMLMYGYESKKGVYDKINLKPICKLKSKITFLKMVEKGASIGYSRSFIARQKTKVATIPLGYVDGLKRELSNKGSVFINGKKVPIIGKICMDSFMADVTNIENVKIGDDVWVWDNENVTLDEISQICNTVNYETMSTISDRVPRIFV